VATLDEMITAPLLILQDKMSKYPLLAMCASWLMGTKYVDSPDLPAAMATDGVRVLVNTKRAEAMGHKVMAMVLAHESLHGLFEHTPAMKAFGPSYDDPSKQGELQRKCNIAMDIIINTCLEQAFGERISWKEDGKPCDGLYIDTKTPAGKYIITAEGRKNFNLDDCDFYWMLRHLDDKALEGGHGAALGNDVLGGGDPSTEMAAGRAAQRAIAQAQAMAKYGDKDSWGNMPGWMSRFFKDLTQPKCDWRKELYDMHQSVRPVDVSFRKLKSPYVFYGAGAPTLSVPGLGEVVFANDTSGSMTDEIMAAGISELRGIWQSLRPEKIHVLHVDHAVGHAESLDPDDPFEVHPKGGGGTAFEPAFKWVEENGVEPACLIYFTDGYGSFPAVEPDYQTIWLYAPGAAPKDPPFGRVIRM